MSGFSDNNPYALEAAAAKPMQGNAMISATETRVLAEVKSQVQMAKMFPRDMAAAFDNILRECRRPALAEQSTYSYERGGTPVTGASIRLAEVIARAYGNLSYGYTVIDRSNGRSLIEAYAWDLETNLRVQRTFEVRHERHTKSKTYMLTDDRDIYELESNMSARRVRAAILSIIPGDVVDGALHECESTIAANARMDTAEGRAKTIKGIMDAFHGFGVSLEDLEGYVRDKFQKASSVEWDVKDIAKLRALYLSIKEQIVTIGTVWPHLEKGNQNATITKEQATNLLEFSKRIGKQGDFSAMLKQIGIAKVADIPVSLFNEVVKWLEDAETFCVDTETGEVVE